MTSTVAQCACTCSTTARQVSGARMSQELARHGYRISPGTRYPLLHSLDEEGLLTSVQPSEAGWVRGSTATASGRQTLAQARGALVELARELPEDRGVPESAGRAGQGQAVADRAGPRALTRRGTRSTRARTRAG